MLPAFPVGALRIGVPDGAGFSGWHKEVRSKVATMGVPMEKSVPVADCGGVGARGAGGHAHGPQRGA